MNSREIMWRVLHREKTDRQPVALLSGGVWTLNRAGYSLRDALALGPERSAEIFAETNKLVRSDAVWVGSGYHNLGVYALGGQIKWRSRGAPDVVAALVDKAAELDPSILARLADNPEINVLWDTAEYLEGFIGDHTMVGASQWGPFTLAGHIYGVEKLMRNIYRDKEEVRAVLEFTSELCCQYLAPFVDRGVRLLSVADPTSSGDLISREQFREFSLPYLKQVVGRLQQKGAAVFIHICGNITNRLDLIPETGANLLSLDYKVDLAQVREALAGRMAFSGNMNPVGIMQNATAEQVAAACRECIARAGDDSHYVLMPGCDIPPGVPLENIRAMVDAAHSLGS